VPGIFAGKAVGTFARITAFAFMLANKLREMLAFRA
jgi:hypothetical protein